MNADGRKDSPGVCPLCGTYVKRLWDRHRAACLGDPAVLAQVRAELDDGTGRALRIAEYERDGVARPVSGSYLRKFFGSWVKAAEALGLRPAGEWRGAGDYAARALAAEAALEDMAAEAALLRVTLASTRAELDRGLALAVKERMLIERTPRRIDGTWPADDLRRAFVEGAAWWNFNSTGFTMFSSERAESENEAESRFPGGKRPTGEVAP